MIPSSEPRAAPSPVNTARPGPDSHTFRAVREAPGYLHPLYASSFSPYGRPRRLRGSGGWVLERPIAGSGYRDVMGLYPRFFCQDWSRLPDDLRELSQHMVTLTLVTSPFAPDDRQLLQRCFDQVTPYKKHFIIDLLRPLERIGTRRHRKYARRAARRVQIDICPDPAIMLEEWLTLYAHLVERHDIRGIQAFSRAVFEAQLQVPGTLMIRARLDGRTVGLQTYIEMGDVVYAHLAAAAPQAYPVQAAYALHQFAIRHYHGRQRWLDLGAGAGIFNDATGGLSQYKRSWACQTRAVHLCMRTFDQQIYRGLCSEHDTGENDFFPYYRKHQAA